MVFSENGIIKKAQEAAEKINKAVVNEQAELNDLYADLDNVLNSIGEEPIKLVKPTVNLNGYTPGMWTNENIIIQLSGNVEGVQYQYSDNGGSSWQNCNTTITIDKDQDKTYIFRATDKNNNYSETTEEYQIKRDAVAPTFKISGITGETGGSAHIVVNVTDESDEMSGISVPSEISYYIKLQEEETYNLVYTGVNRSYDIENLSFYQTYNVKVEIKDNAGNIGSVTKSVGTLCFAAGTEVLTENGMKNIEDINIGDKVYTINLDNNQRELKTVKDKYEGVTTEMFELTINDEIVRATPRHQFYIVDKGWVRAYNLVEGDRLVSKGEEMVISHIEHKTNLNKVPIYNLTVDGNHNYLVTKYEILVHNAGSNHPDESWE